MALRRASRCELANRTESGNFALPGKPFEGSEQPDRGEFQEREEASPPLLQRFPFELCNDEPVEGPPVDRKKVH